uniref:Uncharacterized protein n=1 Tax=Onchocerca volvulus TaxID=6282 RepID=A0A8R1XWJ4_ONCVO
MSGKERSGPVDESGIRTHASEETGALNQRLRPLGHLATTSQQISQISSNVCLLTQFLFTTHTLFVYISIPSRNSALSLLSSSIIIYSSFLSDNQLSLGLNFVLSIRLLLKEKKAYPQKFNIYFLSVGESYCPPKEKEEKKTLASRNHSFRLKNM